MSAGLSKKSENLVNSAAPRAAMLLAGLAAVAFCGAANATIQIGAYGTADARGIGVQESFHTFSNTSELGDPSDPKLYLTPGTASSSTTGASGGASSYAIGSMGVLGVSASANWSGWTAQTSGGGAGGRATAGATDTIQASTTGLVNFALNIHGTSTGPLGSNPYGDIGGAIAVGSLQLYDLNGNFDDLLPLTFDSSPGSSGQTSGTVTLIAGHVYELIYGMEADANVYSNFQDQGMHSASADFSNTLRVQLTPETPGLTITSASGYDYVHPVPEPATFVSLLLGLGSLLLLRSRSVR